MRGQGVLPQQDSVSDTERMLSTLLANLPGMVYRCRNDEDWTMLFVSEGCEALTGFAQEELMSGGITTYGELIHPEDRPVVWSLIQAGVAKRDPYNLHYRMVSESGDVKWVSERGRGVFDEEGALLFLEGFVTDVTEQIWSREALRESEERFRAISEQATDVVFVTDTRGVLDYISPVARGMFGFDRREMQGAHIAQLLAPESIEVALGAFADAVNTGRSIRGLELHMRRKDRSVFFGELTGSRYTTGSFEGVAGTIRDITERKWSERELQIASHALEHAGIGLVSLDRWGRIREVNEYVCETLGYSREELLGMSAFDITLDLDPESWPERWLELKERGSLTFEKEFRARSGRLVPVELSTRIVEFEGEELNHGFVRDISDRKRAEREIEVTAQAIDNAGLGMLRIDKRGRLLAANEYMCRKLGFSREELLGMTIADLTVGLSLEEWPARWRLLQEASPLMLEKEYRTKDGGTVPFEISATIFQVDGEKYDQCFLRDTSERRAAELALRERDEQLLQAQKMESVGRLAGGVAHDYNNMLSVILGHADLALTQIDPQTPLHEDVEEIRKAAQRSATLTRQLLAFARRQPANPRIIDLNATVGESRYMLRRLISEDVALDWLPDPDLWPVRIDPVQVDQILTNLCVNARDAVSPGGTIAIQTANVAAQQIDPVLRGEAPIGVEGFVRLSVSDNGQGMEQDVLEHAFEPFYTTKGSGRGTGLGLATVYGIVTQNGGFVDARSEVGMGSVMSVYLPRAEGEVAQDPTDQSRAAAKSRGETVLLVEDEPAILAMAERVLKSLGYSVLTSSDPEQAVALVAAYPEGIDLLITDVIMPGMNGQVLAQRVKALRPRARCLFMSGYTADVIAPEGVIPPDTHFIQKPFTVTALAAKVHEVLNRDRG